MRHTHYKSRGFGGKVGVNYPELWNSDFVYGGQMMDDNINEAVIECKCGSSALTVADGKAILYFQCGCEDCRQALQWDT